MIKLGIICSAPHLGDFAVQSNFHLILPHLFTRPDYLNFYVERVKAGDFVVQDNSIFELEHSLSGEELLEYAHKYNFSEMVAPEVLRDSTLSKQALLNFLNYREIHGGTVPVMAVVQGDTVATMINYAFSVNCIDEVSTIGIPFDLDHLNTPYYNIKSLTLKRVLNRWFLIKSLSGEASCSDIKLKPIHLMGLSDGVELQYYKEYDEVHPYLYIRSNDSSTCFVHGSHLIRYSLRGLPGEKISDKLNFSLNLRAHPDYRFVAYSQIASCINHNIKMLKEFVNTKV